MEQQSLEINMCMMADVLKNMCEHQPDVLLMGEYGGTRQYACHDNEDISDTLEKMSTTPLNILMMCNDRDVCASFCEAATAREVDNPFIDFIRDALLKGEQVASSYGFYLRETPYSGVQINFCYIQNVAGNLQMFELCSVDNRTFNASDRFFEAFEQALQEYFPGSRTDALLEAAWQRHMHAQNVHESLSTCAMGW